MSLNWQARLIGFRCLAPPCFRHMTIVEKIRASVGGLKELPGAKPRSLELLHFLHFCLNLSAFGSEPVSNLAMEKTVLEERMQDYSSIYSKSAVELSSNSALEPLFKYFLNVSPSSKGKSRGISPPPAVASNPAKLDEVSQLQLPSPQNSPNPSRKLTKSRAQTSSPLLVAPKQKESVCRVFEAKCITKCQSLNAASQALPSGFMEATQASVRVNDLAKRASQLIALENQMHEAIETSFEEAMKDLESQFSAERSALQKVTSLLMPAVLF